jgi:hypothetical protein
MSATDAFIDVTAECGEAVSCRSCEQYEAEEEETLQRRSSDPLWPEFCVGHREVHGEA